MVQVFNKIVSVELSPERVSDTGEVPVDLNVVITNIRVRGLNNDRASPIEVVVEVETSSGVKIVTPYLVMPTQVIDASIAPSYDLIPHGDVIKTVRLNARYTTGASEISRLNLTVAGYTI